MARNISGRCVAGAAALLGVIAAAGVQAQTVAEGWTAVEDFAGGTDKGVELAHWVDGNDHWIFVCGFVTDGSHTRLAVWKYNADDGPGQDTREVIFPDPDTYPTIGGNTAATGITVDPQTGDVYVCGYTQLKDTATNWPDFDTDFNYITLKFDGDDLDLSSSWLPQPTGVPEPGFRLYDHEGLDDRAVDIVWSGEGTGSTPKVCVTGSSKDAQSDYDVVTLEYDGATGALSPGEPVNRDPAGFSIITRCMQRHHPRALLADLSPPRRRRPVPPGAP